MFLAYISADCGPSKEGHLFTQLILYKLNLSVRDSQALSTKCYEVTLKSVVLTYEPLKILEKLAKE